MFSLRRLIQWWGEEWLGGGGWRGEVLRLGEGEGDGMTEVVVSPGSLVDELRAVYYWTRLALTLFQEDCGGGGPIELIGLPVGACDGCILQEAASAPLVCWMEGVCAWLYPARLSKIHQIKDEYCQRALKVSDIAVDQFCITFNDDSDFCNHGQVRIHKLLEAKKSLAR